MMSGNQAGDSGSTQSDSPALDRGDSRETRPKLSLKLTCNNVSNNERETVSTVDSELSAMIPEVPSRDLEMGRPRSETMPSVVSEDVFLLDSPLPSTPCSILKPTKDNIVKDPLLESLSIHLSGLYAMLLVIIGAVIPVSEPFTLERRPYLFQGFYVYLYFGSLSFLLFMFIHVLRKTHIYAPCLKSQCEDANPDLHRNSFHQNFSIDDSPHSHTGSFYLRLGAVAFGIGSMIKSGLMFGCYIESNLQQFCKEAIYGIRPVAHFMFTFSQLYFVFLHSKVCVHSCKVVSRFGFMHMVATNLCVWVGNIVEETLSAIRESDLMEKEAIMASSLKTNVSLVLLKNTSHVGAQTVLTSLHTATLLVLECERGSIMQRVVNQSASYLYPCSIEYSLICAGILYIMWQNIGKKGISYDQEEAKVKAKRLNLDCTGSSRGLFLGILVLVAVIITVVVFFVLGRSENGHEAAVMLEHLSEIVIYVITSVTVIIAFYKMHGLRFLPGIGMDLEQNLIVVALAGIYIFSILSIIAGSFLSGKIQSVLIIVSSVLRMFQATVQTIFMLNSLRRCAHLRQQEKQKPGREFVTFLLMVNIAMWIINTFEVQQAEANPIQIDFYGVLSWNIFTHLSSPLAIFYRFHSTVCLSNIWKHAWKRKRA